MARRKYARSIEDPTVEELRHLLIEKQRAERERRLDNFRRTGRVVKVEPRPGHIPLDSLRTSPQYEEERIADIASPRSKRRTWLDRMLFIVEAAAVVGLVFVVFNGLNIMRDLNQEVAAVLEQPTLTPTPLIKAVVLPSGHTPPKAGEQSTSKRCRNTCASGPPGAISGRYPRADSRSAAGRAFADPGYWC